MEGSSTRAMEGLPATRLPEADSLPDGFVESFAADQAPPPSSDLAVDDAPRTALDSNRTAASVPDVGETLGASSLTTSAVAAGEVLDASSAAGALGGIALEAAVEPEQDQERRGPADDTTGDPSLLFSRYFFCCFSRASRSVFSLKGVPSRYDSG
jgi:hypothetical protein